MSKVGLIARYIWVQKEKKDLAGGAAPIALVRRRNVKINTGLLFLTEKKTRKGKK